MANVNNDDEIEIHNLPEVSTLQAGMMVAVDSQPTGTKCFNLSTALESKASASDVSDLATAVAGKADASDVTALETAVSGKADADALARKEDKVFIAEYNVTSYDDIETAYNAGKQILCHYTINQSNLYIKLSMKTPVANGGMMFNGLITYTESCWIRVWKENGETRWDQKNYSLVYKPDNPSNGQVLSYTNDGNVYTWTDINEVPASTSTDSGKVLKVGSTGTPSWGNEIFIATYHVTPFADILAAKNRGEIIMLLMPALPNMHGPLLSLFNMTDTFAYFTAATPGTTSSPSELWTVEVSTDGTTDTWSSPIVNKCAQLGSITIETDSSPVMIGGLNNGFGTMSLNRSSFTLIVKVNDGEVINFAIEIANSQSCQLTIQKQVGNTTTTLKHSVAAGNTLEANKTYQVTAVGNCWTMAEFEA